jgi:hypothetical protein
MTLLESYAIPLDHAALKTFMESIAAHYQFIALHFLGPNPESSLPGQEYPRRFGPCNNITYYILDICDAYARERMI